MKLLGIELITLLVLAIPAYSKPYEKLASLIKAQIERSEIKNEVGIWIAAGQFEKEEAILSISESKKMIPASLTKIVTAGALLDELKPGFKFVTSLLSDAKMSEATLQGALYLKGGGDPAFVSEKMWYLVNEFRRNGLTTIEGDLIIDDTRFDASKYDSSRDSQRVDRAFDAPVGAVSFNWNSVNVFIRPGNKIGDPLQVTIDPTNDYIELLNKGHTSPKNKSKKIDISRIHFDTKNQIHIDGSLPIEHEEVTVYKGVTDPALWTGYNLIEFLKQRNISIKGKIKKGSVPLQAKLLAQVSSEPLEKLVLDMNKFSNNYVAEMLTKNLAFETGASQGTMPLGIKRIQKFIEKLGLSDQDLTIVNPSGFARKNEFTPKGLGRVLLYLKQEFSLYPEFLSSLPVSGVDGTLKSRLQNGSTKRSIRAKTGLLNGVVGLAGYAGRPDGKQITFVFIYNGPDKKTSSAKDYFDRWASLIVSAPED